MKETKRVQNHRSQRKREIHCGNEQCRTCREPGDDEDRGTSLAPSCGDFTKSHFRTVWEQKVKGEGDDAWNRSLREKARCCIKITEGGSSLMV